MSLGLANRCNTSGVPHLQLHFLVADLDPSELEVYSDRRQQLIVELVVHELTQQGGFAYVEEVVPTAESPTSTNLYSAATTGIMIELYHLRSFPANHRVASTFSYIVKHLDWRIMCKGFEVGE